jgi:hypothetical protein
MSRRHLAVLVATGALALAAPVSGASAQLPTFDFPLPASGGSTVTSGSWLGGEQIGSAGCVGPNRPSVGGSTGSTSSQSCGALLSFSGPQIGQISTVIGPTVIGSPFAQVNVSSGAITEVGTSSP